MAKVKSEQVGSPLWQGWKIIAYKCDSKGIFSVDVPGEIVQTGEPHTITGKTLDECQRKFGEAHTRARESSRVVERFIVVSTRDRNGGFHGGCFNLTVRADVFDRITTKRPAPEKDHIRIERPGRDDGYERPEFWRIFNTDYIGDSWTSGAAFLPYSPELESQFEKMAAALQHFRRALDGLVKSPEQLALWAQNMNLPLALPEGTQPEIEPEE